MATCKAVWLRHEQIAARVARAVDLLHTRVSIAQEADTARLLRGMDRTARNQLRLQRAVKGLSVAAISYYVLSLSGVALRSVHAAHLIADPDLIEGPDPAGHPDGDVYHAAHETIPKQSGLCNRTGTLKALAAEYGPQGVRINAILPGAVDTEMYRGMNDTAESQAFVTAQVCGRPCGRFRHAATSAPPAP
ncbi:hypothetical protein OKW41_004488 [Paraburkholderia sp. UCT70]